VKHSFDEVNTLALMNYKDLFKDKRYQLVMRDGQVPRDLKAYIAFGADVTYGRMEKLFSEWDERRVPWKVTGP
jgi:hypothetical protein